MKLKKNKKKVKQHKKQVKSAKTEIKSTLGLLQIEQVNEYHVDLVKGKRHEIMLGIKLEPHALFLDNKQEQKRRIHLLRSALNRLKFDIWHGFVFNPINLDVHLISLARQLNKETDDVIREMLQDDIDKAQMFIQLYRELEFFMMIKGKAGKKIEDNYHQLQASMQSAGFKIKPLTRLDYDNYISYAFENDLVNDYYFSRGLFDDALETETVEEDEE